MQWEVVGADKESGKNRRVKIEADTEESAGRRASRAGLMVSKIRPFSQPAAAPVVAIAAPVADYAPPSYPVVASVPAPDVLLKTSGLGVAGMILGIIALLICWVPIIGFLALPLGALGLILAGVGLIVAYSGKRHGFGLPIAGTVISLFSLIGFFLVAAMWAALFGSAAKQIQNANQQAIQHQQQQQLAAPATSP